MWLICWILKSHLLWIWICVAFFVVASVEVVLFDLIIDEVSEALAEDVLWVTWIIVWLLWVDLVVFFCAIHFFKYITVTSILMFVISISFIVVRAAHQIEFIVISYLILNLLVIGIVCQIVIYLIVLTEVPVSMLMQVLQLSGGQPFIWCLDVAVSVAD